MEFKNRGGTTFAKAQDKAALPNPPRDFYKCRFCWS
jgi:hypothetical protein